MVTRFAYPASFLLRIAHCENRDFLEHIQRAFDDVIQVEFRHDVWCETTV